MIVQNQKERACHANVWKEDIFSVGGWARFVG